MRSIFFIFLCFPVCLLVQQQQKGELFLVTPPPGWERAFHEEKNNVLTVEYIPSGQTTDEWKDMVTMQIMYGLGNINPEEYLGKMVTAAEQVCDNLGARVVPFTQASAYRSRGIIQSCGRVGSTSQGEFTIIRVISGKDSLYVIQKAWKLPAWKASENPGVDDDEILQWIDYLASARVCDTRENTCP